MTTLPKPTTETTEKIRVALDWQAVASAAAFTEVKFHKAESIAKITINRPEVRNSFTPRTVEEMRAADSQRKGLGKPEMGKRVMS